MKQFYEIDGWFGLDHIKVYDYLIENTKSGGSLLELGAWLGRSTAYLVDNAPNLNITVIDSWEGSDSELDTNHKLVKTEDIFSMFKENMGNRKFKYLKGRAEFSETIYLESVGSTIEGYIRLTNVDSRFRGNHGTRRAINIKIWEA